MRSSVVPVFEPVSPQAAEMRDLFVKVLAISGVIFAVMATLIVLAIVRFRARPGDALPVQDHGSERREIIWMLGPILVVAWLAAVTTKLVLSINSHAVVDPPSDQPARLIVTGHQWWWEARYPLEQWPSASGDATSTDVLVANEIHIPVGTPIRVAIEAADVIHCFWVPQLARKIDAIPGRTNHIWLQADQPGTYQGFCAEFCGTQHAWMRFLVIAQPQAEFDAWLASQRSPAPTPEAAQAALAATGGQLFRSMACVDCHAFGDVGTRTPVGPDLTHLAQRTILGAGVIGNSPEDLRRWLENPQAVKPGSKMPDFRLTGPQIDALMAYFGVTSPTPSTAPPSLSRPPTPTGGAR